MVSKFCLIVLLCISQTIASSDNITDVLEWVNSNVTAANSYVIPSDNSALLKVVNSTTVELPAHDFIIIGSGSAGAVLANRLTENKNWNVLLLEAGQREDGFTDILSLSSAYSVFSDYNWGYNSTSQKNACLAAVDQQCPYPRGRARGGSSSIDYGVYTKGNPLDYERWEQLGNTGWEWKNVNNYFLKSENAVFEDQEAGFHGTQGPLYVDVTSKTPGLESNVSKAFAELGLASGDINGSNQTRLDRIQFLLKGNRRHSVAHGYLDGFEDTRTNLITSYGSFVIKLLIDNSTKTAYGVKFIKDGKIYTVNATKEVIVSAGSINTPQILMLSGIGPASHLTELGIDIVQDLPVGENLEDHVGYLGLYYRTNNVYWNLTNEVLLERWIQNLRPYTAGLCSEMIAFLNVNGGSLGRPDTELDILNSVFPSAAVAKAFRFNEAYTNTYDNALTDIWFIPALQHPKSRGSVRLQSSDPKDVPLIDPNFFSDEEGYDMETMYKAIQYLLKLNNTQTFKDFHATFHHVPMPSCDSKYEKLSKDWWICGIKTLSIPFYNPSGTTRMGSSTNNSVVNSKLQVHGMKNLRIVDAGVMPETITGHINAAVIMIGEKAADIIKEAYGAL